MDVPRCIVPAVAATGARQFTIANDGDFIIQLTPPAKPLTDKVANSQPKSTRFLEFRVSRDILIAHSAFFRDLFGVQPGLPFVVIENNGISHALETWLRAIHNGADTIPQNLRAILCQHVWAALAVGEQFGFAPQHTQALKPWFLQHYHQTLNDVPSLTPRLAQMLAFPCSVFDHAEGFMKLTKFLAYNTNGTLFTHNPSHFQALRTDTRILDAPLTAARAHIQSVIREAIYLPLEKLHDASCACRKETSFDYEDSLRGLRCWPLDTAFKLFTIQEVIEKLAGFTFKPNAVICQSGVCLQDFKRSVNVAINKAKFDFDGLCLDCMNRSKSTSEQPEQEFVEKNSPYNGCWDMDCRYGHGRVTWDFSWMGPSSIRRRIVANARRERPLRVRREKAAQRTADSKQGNSSIAPIKTLGGDHNKGVVSRRSITMPLHGFAALPTGKRDKENSYDKYDVANGPDDDEDEFFDAEDTYLDGANDGEVLDHDKIN